MAPYAFGSSRPSPITIPLPSLAPSPISQNDPPRTPTRSTSRIRSDTILTTSSSSSEQHLQTPQTPSIIGTLNGNGNGGDHFKLSMVEFPDQVVWTSRVRKGSYGFSSAAGSSSWVATGAEIDRIDRSSSGVSDMSMGTSDDLPEVTSGPPLSTSPMILDLPLTSSAATAREEDTIALPPVFTTVGTTEPIPASQAGLFISSNSVETNHRPEPKRSKSSFRAAVRRKLERSKSSFRSLASSSAVQDHEQNSSSTTSSIALALENDSLITVSSTSDANAQIIRPKRSRLKSLLSLSKRTNSSLSISSHMSTSSNGTSLSGHLNGSTIHLVPSNGQPVPSAGTPVQALDSVIVRDFAHLIMNDDNGDSDQIEQTERGASISAISSRLNTPPINKGKGRARSTSFTKIKSQAQRISSSGLSLSRPGSPVSHDKIIDRGMLDILDPPHAVSVSPADTAIASAVCEVAKVVKVNLFDTLLPRELRIVIMQNLVDSCSRENRRGRFAGKDLGRKELIKFTRVSKEWQDLCYDGQLWPLLDLLPFAHCLHPRTVSRILAGSKDFITTLSLRGMDTLNSLDLLSSLAEEISSPCYAIPATRIVPLTMASLHTLDLRGCKRLQSHNICSLITAAPNLAHVNFKGVQAVSSAVLRELSHSSRLEYINVSRCWDITLGDFVVYLDKISETQATRLKTLHIAGIRSFGYSAVIFFTKIAERLVNLSVLDIQGSTGIFDDDIFAYAFRLDDEDMVSNLTHLNISNCSRLTCRTFGHLARHVPHLTHLEAAGLPDAFHERDDEAHSLARFLKSTPKLQRLDLDGTGAIGGVTDRVLDMLSCGRDEEGEMVGKELIEVRLGYAKQVTAEALVRLVRMCPKLRVLDVDNTAANNAVMREFMRRRSEPDAMLSVIDCRTITQTAYDALVPCTRARQSFTGWKAVPFGYDRYTEAQSKPVLKTFYSWRRVVIPRGWRETRAEAERADLQENGIEEQSVKGKSAVRMQRPGNNRRSSSWWRGDDMEDDGMRGGCTIM